MPPRYHVGFSTDFHISNDGHYHCKPMLAHGLQSRCMWCHSGPWFELLRDTHCHDAWLSSRGLWQSRRQIRHGFFARKGGCQHKGSVAESHKAAIIENQRAYTANIAGAFSPHRHTHTHTLLDLSVDIILWHHAKNSWPLFLNPAYGAGLLTINYYPAIQQETCKEHLKLSQGATQTSDPFAEEDRAAH